MSPFLTPVQTIAAMSKAFFTLEKRLLEVFTLKNSYLHCREKFRYSEELGEEFYRHLRVRHLSFKFNN